MMKKQKPPPPPADLRRHAFEALLDRRLTATIDVAYQLRDQLTKRGVDFREDYGVILGLGDELLMLGELAKSMREEAEKPKPPQVRAPRRAGSPVLRVVR